ncbi:hypothetical protein ACN47E_009125 [Coniothyrium glycines]
MSLPEVVYQKVDEYVDSLAPQIQPRIASELETFQQKTIDSLETQVIDAFRSLFSSDRTASTDEDRGPWNLKDAAPDSYGGLSLPFADEIAKLTRSFDKVSGEAGDDLRDIFDITEGRGDASQPQPRNADFSSGARGFLSSALNIVQDQLNDGRSQGGQGLEIGGLLGVISDTVKDASRNPEEKARLISPEIKDRVGEKLRSQHANIAEQFTKIALDHIKRWLRGNTTSRDLGDGAKAEIQDQVKDLVKGFGGLFKRDNNQETTRGFDESSRSGSERGGGFSGVLSDKLSTGLGRVHREVRIEFRKILGEIEKQLFELLPDQFQQPLEKILGGNPFDSQLDRDAGDQAERSFGGSLKARLLNKIRDLIQKIQETLRGSILGVVNGGHRKFERESWMFVHTMVEQKVQRYLPDVQIKVPDDIGNENVSVGAPTSGGQLGGGLPSAPPTQAEYRAPPSNQGYNDTKWGGNDQTNTQAGYNNRSDFQSSQGYQNTLPPPQEYRASEPNQYQPPQHSYQHQTSPPQGAGQQAYSEDNYHRQVYQQNSQAQGYPPHNYQDGDHQQYNYQQRY